MVRKGQVSTEYLVILAVVLAVALVVVALVGGISPMSSGISESQSADYWAGASPLALTAWRFSGTTLELTFQNEGGKMATLKSISSTGGSSAFNATLNATILSIGQTQTVTITTTSPCSGAFDFSNVVIVYDQGGLPDLHEDGAKDIVGACS